MSILRLGFIGGSCDSAIGYTHFIAARMDNKFEICCACFSTNKKTNHKTASLLNSNIRIYDNYKDLLKIEQGKIDAICILTPTPTHKDIVITALNLGYPVICEKTLCLNSSQALLIQDTLQHNKGFLAVIYNYTGYPMIRELKSMIENGEFGDIFQINIEMPQESFIKTDIQGNAMLPQNWRLKDSKIPTICLDLGIHCHNLISFLLQKLPMDCIAINANYGNFKNIIDTYNILAIYESNIHVNMWFSKSALGFRNGLQIRIFGEKLSAQWLQSNPEEIIFHTKNGERIIKDRASPNCFEAHKQRYNRFKAGHPAGFIEAFGNYYIDIADCLQKYLKGENYTSPYIFGVEESLNGLYFFESAQKSIKSKKMQSCQLNKGILCH